MFPPQIKFPNVPASFYFELVWDSQRRKESEREAKRKDFSPLLPSPEWFTFGRRNDDGEMSPVDRARNYLAKIPGGIEGQNGSGVTFRAAVVLVDGFALEVDEAYPLLAEWSDTKCSPPWSRGELMHKLDDARAKCGNDRGYMLRRSNNYFPPSHKEVERSRVEKEIEDKLAAVEDVADLPIIIPAHSELSDPAVMGPLGDECCKNRARTDKESEAHQRIKEMRNRKYRCPQMFERCMTRNHDGAGTTFHLRCDRLDCPGCGVVYREAHKINFRLHLEQAAASKDFAGLFLIEIPEHQWIMWRMRFRRDGRSNYFKVRTDNGTFIVVTESATAAKLGESLDVEASVAALCAAVDDYQDDGKPVSASHLWRLPRPADEEKTGNYTAGPMCSPRLTVEIKLEILDSLGLATKFLPMRNENQQARLRHKQIYYHKSSGAVVTGKLREHLFFCLSEAEVYPFFDLDVIPKASLPPPDPPPAGRWRLTYSSGDIAV